MHWIGSVVKPAAAKWAAKIEIDSLVCVRRLREMRDHYNHSQTQNTFKDFTSVFGLRFRYKVQMKKYASYKRQERELL